MQSEVLQHQPILLGVNIDHCATLREARYRQNERGHRGMVEPDPMAFALAAERAGADGITVHPREDARHIRRGDVHRLRESLQVPLNMEMACTESMAAFALEIAPAAVCVVPERREEVTTEGGLDVHAQKARVGDCARRLCAAGIAVSLFIDPEPRQIETAAEVGAPFVELHTGAFANAWYDPAARAAELKKLTQAARLAYSIGLTVNLGHGINYTNIRDLRGVPHVHEMNIGHSIVSRALFDGVRGAIQAMRRLMNPGLC